MFFGGMIVVRSMEKQTSPTNISPKKVAKNMSIETVPICPSSASPRFCAFSLTLKGRIRQDTLSCPFMSCHNDRAMGIKPTATSEKRIWQNFRKLFRTTYVTCLPFWLQIQTTKQNKPKKKYDNCSPFHAFQKEAARKCLIIIPVRLTNP